jgi:hypothetical protein
MRTFLWMIAVVLLFTVLGSQAARADTIVTSGLYVTGIDGITINGTTYDVTFGTPDDTTFSSNPLDALSMATEIANDLSPYATVADTAYNTITFVGVDGGANVSVAQVGSIGTIGLSYASYSFRPVFNPSVYSWAEFSVVSTPEPGTSMLTLTGLGLLGLMMVMRKRIGQGLPLAS